MPDFMHGRAAEVIPSQVRVRGRRLAGEGAGEDVAAVEGVAARGQRRGGRGAWRWRWGAG